MNNLAGIDPESATAQVARELAEAEISAEPFTPTGEVRAELRGKIAIGNWVILLDRRWVYWSAQVSQTPWADDWGASMPADLAVALNDAPATGAREYYSGRGSNLGAIVRADGFAGGQESSALKHGVSHWHIDTQEGLNLFAKWCRENLRGDQP